MGVYKDTNGTWFVKCYYVDYLGVKRQRKKRGFKLQREAKEWEHEFLSSLQYDNKTTFGQIAAEFLEEMEPRRRVMTIKAYKAALIHILPTFEALPVSEITEKHYIRWQNDILSLNLSKGYINNLDGKFRTIYRYGIKRIGCSGISFDGLEKIGKSGVRSLKFWTLEQFNRFIATISNPTHRIAFLLLFYTGMRRGELLALTVGDIDTGVIHITKSLQRYNRQNVITPPKTEKGIRDITIPAFLGAELREYIGKLYAYSPDTPLFPISATQLSYQLKKGAEIADLPPIRVHDLRHSHVSMLIDNGVPAMTISERVGHENVNITLGIYGHLYPDKQKEVSELLERLNSSV